MNFSFHWIQHRLTIYIERTLRKISYIHIHGYYPCIAFLSVKSFIFRTLIFIPQYLNREHGHYVEDKNASLWKKWSHFLQHHGHQCRLYNKRIEVETWQSIWRCQSSRYGYSCRLILDIIRSVQHIVYYIFVCISFQ